MCCMQENVIEVNKLSKKYEKYTALNDVSFNVTRGTLHALLGPNGAGKSTLFKIIVGLIKPDSGGVKIFGQSIDKHLIRANYGYLPDLVNYPAYLTCEEVFVVFGQIRGYSKERCLKEAKSLLQLLNLNDRTNQKIGTLSRGLLQRLGVALALLGNPGLLIFDEVFTGCDPATVYDLQKTFKNKVVEGTTILFSSHLLNHVEQISDYITIMDKSVIVTGTTNEIKSTVKGRHKFVRIELDLVNDQIIQALKQYTFIQNISINGNVIEIAVPQDTDCRNQLFSILVQNGAKILSMITHDASIESAFLKLTEGEYKQ